MTSWPYGRARDGGVDPVPLPGDRGFVWLCGKHFIGPDPERALRATGATTVVCLCERAELADRYPGYVAWLDAEAGARAEWQPVPDLHAPAVDEAAALVDGLARRVEQGETLLVHCGAGIGRAGTIAAALLIRLGEPLDGALATVAASRPTAGPEAGAQRELLVALAGRDPRSA